MWQGAVLAALHKAKRYPRDAQRARQQGVPQIHFTMNREGKVLSVTLEHSSGFHALDEEALALPRRAQPLPKPPEEIRPGQDMIELVVPIEFFLRVRP
ncbi:MAG: energy transducer TonB [Sphingopyxis sp.]|nr:energy transducer TonB [Sphingopyxis sp.]